MSIMKRQLLIIIEAGKDTCQECDHRDDDECLLFGRYLDDEGHRAPECIEAEGKMVESQIRISTTLTSAPPTEGVNTPAAKAVEIV